MQLRETTSPRKTFKPHKHLLKRVKYQHTIPYTRGASETGPTHAEDKAMALKQLPLAALPLHVAPLPRGVAREQPMSPQAVIETMLRDDARCAQLGAAVDSTVHSSNMDVDDTNDDNNDNDHDAAQHESATTTARLPYLAIPADTQMQLAAVSSYIEWEKSIPSRTDPASGKLLHGVDALQVYRTRWEAE